MRYCLFGFVVFALFGQTQAAAIRAPSGFFLLTGADQKNINGTDLANPLVAGLSIRFSWATAEPSAGVFNWSYIDSEVAMAKQAGKPYMLRPMAGVNAPNWLYAEGAQQTQSSTGNTMPVPWDPTMLAEWDRFIAALGARYSGDSSLVLAHLGGPTSNSGEMQLPRSLLTEYPNAISLTYGAWQNSINAYKAAFPSNAIALNLANPYSSKDGLLQSVSSYAESALGSRATLQNNSLKSTTSLNFAPVALMQSYASHGGRVGFQSIYDTKMTASQFAAAVQIGKTVGASYYEIYKFQVPYLGSVATANANLAVVPEPAGIALAITGGLALAVWVRRGATGRP